MASVFDVADYILQRMGGMTAMKLQKLCYYSHAWHLVWEERPLFTEEIQAWANGPVVRSLYAAHRGQFSVSSVPSYTGGSAARLDPAERSTIDAIIEFYGPMSAHQLSELTHSERPWQTARLGLPAGARSEVAITDDIIAPYYDSLTRTAVQQ